MDLRVDIVIAVLEIPWHALHRISLVCRGWHATVQAEHARTTVLTAEDLFGPVLAHQPCEGSPQCEGCQRLSFDAQCRAVARGCPRLRRLDLREAQWYRFADHQASLAALFSACRELREVWVCPLAEVSLAAFESLCLCEKLTELHIEAGTRMSTIDETGKDLRSQHSGLYYCPTPISAAGMLLLARRCSSLVVLQLDSCDPTDDFARTISENLCRLRHLGLGEGPSDLTDAGALHLRACTNLTGLDLGGHYQLSDGTITTLVSQLTALEFLDVTDLDGLRDSALIAIGQLRRLHTLRIGDERGYGGDQWGFTDVGLTAVAVGCPALRILTFKGFDAASTTQTARHAVTAAPLFALAAHNSGVLEQLAWECEGPLAEALGALLQRCQRLMHLKVSSCDDCDDSALRVVGAHGKSLITLDASFTAVTGDGVISLVQGLPGLRGLNASYCDEVDEDDAQACEAVLVARGGSFGTIGREFGHPHWKGR
mmetsp:Transcript_29149/g.94873  ORF Transcript_29149/g.94873 Transcript_29149/m.94873 type:complete len:485 (-) Transcript_29149:196-1650(-)